MTVNLPGIAAPGREGAPAVARPRPGVWLTDALLVLMALIWGVNFSVVKFGTQVMPPLAFNGARMALASAALLLIVRVRDNAKISNRDFWRLAALGVLGNGIYQILFVQGVALTRAGDAALVVAASPALIAIVGRIRGVERVTRRGVIGIALSIFGIALVVLGGTGIKASASARNPLLGDLLILTASSCWAMYTILLKPYADRIDGVQLSAATMLGGTVTLLLVAAPDMLAVNWGAVGVPAWGSIAYSGLLALVVAYLCWYRGVRILGPTRTAMYANLQPLIALVVAWLLLDEAPMLTQVAGAAAIMTGLLLTRGPSARKPAR